MRRGLNEFAPPRQLHRWVQLFESRGVKGVVSDSRQRPPNKHLVGILLFLVCFCGSYLLTFVGHYYRGKLEAYWDIAHGRYVGYRCSYQCIDPPGTAELDRRLLEYANIRIETTEDCGFRTRGYNEVQWARVDRIYPGVYERALNEAIEWRRRH